MGESKSKTIGQVPKGISNRYWQCQLPSTLQKSWKSDKVVVYTYWFVHLCLIFLYSFILLLFLKLKAKRTQTVSSEAQKVLSCYPLFLDVYPTSPYPLITKAFELAFFRGSPLREPTLELGTGDGYFTKCLYDSQSEKVTIASDLTGSTLLQAEKYSFWRKLAIIDASEVPLPSNSLSTVIMNNLIHHLPDRNETLKEMYRILRPGGMFIFTDELTGWATSQWHIKIKEGSKSYQKKLGDFLQRGVQCLLSDKQFWMKQAEADGWEVCDIREFFSNRSMYLSSYLETLNRKTGAPTPEAIRDILNRLPLLKRMQLSLTKQIAEYFITRDVELCQKYGATCLFIALRKKGASESAGINEPALVCPACKGELVSKEDGDFCQSCEKVYPRFEGIPFLIPYYEDLPLQSYINQTKCRPLPDVSC